MKSLRERLRRIIAAVYPERCAFCGCVVRPGAGACAACLAQLPRLTQELCPNCGSEKEFCTCRRKKYEFRRCVAPFYYEGPAKKGVLRIKFGKKPAGAAVFAQAAAQIIGREYADIRFDFVTAVPLSRRELRRRGYNQSELFGRELARLLGVPFRPVLEKVRDTRPQRSCPEHERWGNVFGVYRAAPGLSGKTVLLCDDIMTTGATLNECAKMLRLSGAAEVFCAAETCVRKQKWQPSDSPIKSRKEPQNG